MSPSVLAIQISSILISVLVFSFLRFSLHVCVVLVIYAFHCADYDLLLRKILPG